MAMGHRRSCFSADAILTMRENPNTFNVTNSRLTVTLEAKKRILEMYESGMDCQQIVIELGYDPAVLGQQRVKNIVRNTRREAESQLGLHEGYVRTVKAHMSKEEISELDCNPESYARLKNEVIYLREEVEFLKKISQQVIFGKRNK